jgi:hypothetical protein
MRSMVEGAAASTVVVVAPSTAYRRSPSPATLRFAEGGYGGPTASLQLHRLRHLQKRADVTEAVGEGHGVVRVGAQ